MQLVAGSASKLGVDRQDFYGERYLVGDALAGRLPSYPQFKICWRIIESITVFVVNVFIFVQRATKQFFHYIAMLVLFPAASQMNPAIARRMHVPFWVDRTPFPAFPATLLRAKFLFVVVACVATIFGSAKVSISSFAAPLALKCRWRSLVHKNLLALVSITVNCTSSSTVFAGVL